MQKRGYPPVLAIFQPKNMLKKETDRGSYSFSKKQLNELTNKP
jgi:hypothetical protein